MRQTIVTAAVAAFVAACCSFVIAEANQPAHAKPDPNRAVVTELKRLNIEMRDQGQDLETVRTGIGSSAYDAASVLYYLREIQENTR